MIVAFLCRMNQQIGCPRKTSWLLWKIFRLTHAIELWQELKTRKRSERLQEVLLNLLYINLRLCFLSRVCNFCANLLGHLFFKSGSQKSNFDLFNNRLFDFYKNSHTDLKTLHIPHHFCPILTPSSRRGCVGY